MKKTFSHPLFLLILSLFCLEGTILAHPQNSNRNNSRQFLKKADKIKPETKKKLMSRPLLFEENKGQTSENVKFISRGNGFNLLLSANEVVYQIFAPNCDSRNFPHKKRKSNPCGIHSLKMKMSGANAETAIKGVDQAVAESGYFFGHDQNRWLKDINNFRAVRYEKIYPGIELVFRGVEQKLEYDFHLAPGADPTLIRLEFDGMKKVKIDRAGNLVFRFKGTELIHQKPFAYQMIDGEKVAVSAGYILLGKNRIGFKLGNYDKNRELVIDPLVYASYLGGTAGGDSVNDIAVDRNGNIYTASDARFTVIEGSIQYTYSDILITKFDPEGNILDFSTIGGTHDDVPYGMDVDADGRVFVTGITYSTDFPLRFAEQSSHSINIIDRDYMAFVVRLDANLEIDYSTYLGGSCFENYADSIAADAGGNAYVTGYTCSADFPTRNGFQNSLQGSYNAFVTKYDSFGRISYSTLFGNSFTFSRDIFTDGQGSVFITGFASPGLFTTSGAFRTSGQGFVAKFNTRAAGANSIVFSTFIETQGYSVAADPGGNVWAGTRGSGSIQPKIFKLNSTGTALLFTSNPLASAAYAWDLAIDQNGSIYYVDAANPGLKVIGLRPDGTLIGESPFDVGSGITRVFGIALGPQPGIVYLGGHTKSQNFPTTPDAFQPTSGTTTVFGQGFFAKAHLNVPEERNPLIFIPGIAGSTLYEADENGDPIRYQFPDPRISELWTDGLIDVTGNTLSKLYLTPNSQHPEIVAVDAVRRVAPFINVYKPLLDELKRDYIEYEIEGNPKKRNIQCTGEERYNEEKPDLFVFAYDWRQSNVTAAAQLAQYVECVQKFYPGKKVNILTHSMGGLVARRYILDHPNNHNVEKLLTTVAPFLGAPKGIDALFTGRFIGKTFIKGIPIAGGAGIYIYQDTVKEMISYAKGAHQLLPSAWYYELGERPFGYKSPFLQLVTDYSFTEANEILDTKFAGRPYHTANDFHNYQDKSQDDWSLDTSGIKLYHIYGVQSWNTTPGKTLIAPYILFPRNAEQRKYGVETEYSEGDGTVPAVSAERSAHLLAPNTVVKRCESPSWFNDGLYEHNGITTNPVLWNEIRAVLNNTAINQSQCAVEHSSLTLENNAQKLMTSQTANLNNSIEINLLKVYGVERVQITDEAGNTNSPLGIGVEKSVPEIDYEYGSNSADSFVFPHEITLAAGKIADIKLVAASEKIRIEIFKGTNRQNSSEVTKYMDLQLPIGVTAWLKFTATGVENLRYDADGDGVFETEVQPVFHLTGAAANDRTSPNIDISFTVNNNLATVTVNAADHETGINQIRYDFDGEITDHFYHAPFIVDLTQSKLIYVSAEDNAGNRNLLAKWIDAVPPSTTVTLIPSVNSSGWSKTDVDAEIKALDDLGGSGVESLIYSGNGAQLIPEETLSVKEIPFSFPQPSTPADFLAKSLLVNAEGTTNLTFFAKDHAGNIETLKTVAIKIDKTAPETTANYVLNGNQALVTLDSTDIFSGIETIYYSVDGGSLQAYSAPFAVSGSGNHQITYFAGDLAGNIEAQKFLDIIIPNTNVNPTITMTSPASGSIYQIGSSVSFSGNFSDDQCNLHTAVWTFDNISQAGTVSEPSREVTLNYTFTSAGVYFVTLTVSNNCGGTGSANTIDGLTAMVVIYDPDGGFVTGGGWFDSPVGAYMPNPNLTGKASFGFNSKYQRGANIPTGNTEFQFRVADFNFKSSSYDWLVVGGAKAQFKGTGTINGIGNYGFMLTVIDGQINGSGGTDKFRIKIWNKTDGNIIYDNQPESGDNGNPITMIGGGNIIIHRQ